MIQIHKITSLSSLSQYKRECSESMTRGCSQLLDDFQDKDILRRQLAEEQGYICAYCMQRISIQSNETKIEHVMPQTKFPLKQLDYSNLLLCCNGNDKSSKKYQHCDTKKGSRLIKFDPVSHHCIEETINYDHNGKIYSKDKEWDRDLNEVLNLNETRLRENRRAVLRGLEQYLGRRPGARTRAEIDSKLKDFETKKEDGLTPYCGIMIYQLKRHPAYRL